MLGNLQKEPDHEAGVVLNLLCVLSEMARAPNFYKSNGQSPKYFNQRIKTSKNLFNTFCPLNLGPMRRLCILYILHVHYSTPVFTDAKLNKTMINLQVY